MLHRDRLPSAVAGLGLAPISWGNTQGDQDQQELADSKQEQPQRRAFAESVRMETDPQFVHTKPGPARNDITSHHQSGQSPRTNQSTPAGVQNQGRSRAR